MSALYILRIDDACPTMDKDKWERIETILDRFNIKPIVAVIPDNNDPEMKIDDSDSNFWNKVKKWEQKGWFIGLHGYDHLYITKNSGIIPINKQSEFAGVDIEIQRMKIREAVKIFDSYGINPNVWIAPSHAFDKDTMRVLKEETNIRIISDGIAFYPYFEDGFFWIPQQNWHLSEKKEGVWTSCYHPNYMNEEDFIELEFFIQKHKHDFVPDIYSLLKKYKSRRRSFKDRIFFIYFFSIFKLYKIKDKIAKKNI